MTQSRKTNGHWTQLISTPDLVVRCYFSNPLLKYTNYRQFKVFDPALSFMVAAVHPFLLFDKYLKICVTY